MRDSMPHETYTPEVLVALAAGHLRAEAAAKAHAAIAADEDLALEYEGVLALVQDMGPSNALSYLEEAYDREQLRHKGPVRRSMKRTAAVWSAIAAIAASVLVLLHLTFNGPAARPEQLAMAILDTPLRIEQVRGGEAPAWAHAYDRGDHLGTVEALRSTGTNTPLEDLVMGYSLLRMDPPLRDSALVHFEQAAAKGERYRDQALTYAGALAFELGDTSKALQLLAGSRDQRAVELRDLITKR